MRAAERWLVVRAILSGRVTPWTSPTVSRSLEWRGTPTPVGSAPGAGSAGQGATWRSEAIEDVRLGTQSSACNRVGGLAGRARWTLDGAGASRPLTQVFGSS